MQQIANDKGTTISEVLRTAVATFLTAPGDPAAALVECQKGYKEAVERLETMERALLFSTDLEILSEAQRAGWSWESLFRALAKVEIALADPAKVERVLCDPDLRPTPESALGRWLYVFIREMKRQLPGKDLAALFGLPQSSFIGKDPKAIMEMLQTSEK